jgi:hypothetical protein
MKLVLVKFEHTDLGYGCFVTNKDELNEIIDKFKEMFSNNRKYMTFSNTGYCVEFDSFDDILRLFSVHDITKHDYNKFIMLDMDNFGYYLTPNMLFER